MSAYGRAEDLLDAMGLADYTVVPRDWLQDHITELSRLRAQVAELLPWAELGADGVLNDRRSDPGEHDKAWYIRERIWAGDFGEVRK